MAKAREITRLYKEALGVKPEPTEAEKFEKMAERFADDREMAAYYRERAQKARAQLGESK